MNLNKLFAPPLFFEGEGDGGGGEPLKGDSKPKDPPAGAPGNDPPPSDEVPRSWKEVFEHPEFKKLRKRATEAEAALAKIETDNKARQEKELKEQEQWKELADKREQELAAERSRNLRMRIAIEKGLPAEMMDRLRGETEEELAADADKLLEFVKEPGSKGVPPKKPGGAPNAPFDFDKASPAEIRKAREEGKISLASTTE